MKEYRLPLESRPLQLYIMDPDLSVFFPENFHQATDAAHLVSSSKRDRSIAIWRSRHLISASPSHPIYYLGERPTSILRTWNGLIIEVFHQAQILSFGALYIREFRRRVSFNHTNSGLEEKCYAMQLFHDFPSTSCRRININIGQRGNILLPIFFTTKLHVYIKKKVEVDFFRLFFLFFFPSIFFLLFNDHKAGASRDVSTLPHLELRNTHL